MHLTPFPGFTGWFWPLGMLRWTKALSGLDVRRGLHVSQQVKVQVVYFLPKRPELRPPAAVSAISNHGALTPMLRRASLPLGLCSHFHLFRDKGLVLHEI